MATAYSIILPNPPGVLAPITVRIVAMRDDAKNLSREELEALAAAYPPPDETARTHVALAIKRARSRPGAAPSKTSKASPSTRPSSKTATAAPKRKAAKRPTRDRAK